MSVDIGIDLGTASVLVYVKGKGVILKEPSVVAFDRDSNIIRAIGEEARLMLGRTPGNVVAIRPLRHGVISDYTVTEKMIKYFVQKAMGKRSFKKPRISICVPSGVTEVERKAVEEATYAADHCGADWNEQALLKALSYLDTLAFSYTGLIDQLEFEEFTPEQARYAVDRCGADWNEQAVKKAQSYLEVMAFSKEGLIDQLEFEGFTHEQAVYGVEQNGY